MVLVPSPITVAHPRNHDDSVLSGTTYGTAMVSVSFAVSCNSHVVLVTKLFFLS